MVLCLSSKTAMKRRISPRTAYIPGGLVELHCYSSCPLPTGRSTPIHRTPYRASIVLLLLLLGFSSDVPLIMSVCSILCPSAAGASAPAQCAAILVYMLAAGCPYNSLSHTQVAVLLVPLMYVLKSVIGTCFVILRAAYYPVPCFYQSTCSAWKFPNRPRIWRFQRERSIVPH